MLAFMILPHQSAQVLSAGAALANARAAMLMFHGRGAPAADILSLARSLTAPGMCFLAPQADGSSWWPQRFLVPIQQNEPHISGAMQRASALMAQLRAADIPIDRTFVLGFSQGACLALEFAARNPAGYAGVIALSGALIENGDQPREYTGWLHHTPVFLGCSDVDPHIPLARVERSAEIMRGLGAAVTCDIYPGMGHTISRAEVQRVQTMINALPA